jgi:hypothetical protein
MEPLSSRLLRRRIRFGGFDPPALPVLIIDIKGEAGLSCFHEELL